ncbi:hypothetical protein BpHYR1_015163 [Brachionus plicatilis]|uniref:Uncharacterized protein n=1 Tax=Brachionus plicatilis TaxID=10195 RepID=A0A3M7Q5W2_BRAPC|nr:hypothetical protein BpHYR1_015163 [Brachionus plicatilis]
MGLTILVAPNPAQVDQAPAPVDPALTPVTPAATPVLSPASVVNVYPQVVAQLDADNLFRRLNLGCGRSLHRSAIDLRRLVPAPVQTPAPIPDAEVEDKDYVDAADEL